MKFIPEDLIPVVGAAPATTNGGITASYISLKNTQKAWIVVTLKQAVGHATAITPKQAKDVAGTNVKNFDKDLDIWANEDVATSDVLVQKAAGKSYTVANTAKNKLVVFAIDPAKLDTAGGFDCVGVTIADSGQATNLASVLYLVEPRYLGGEVSVIKD